MSHFTALFVHEQLNEMGWPRKKGILRREYVYTILVDNVVESAIEMWIGLGAGRPHLGAAVIADLYSNNPWTKESTHNLLQSFKEKTLEIDSNPNLLPWQAIYLKRYKLETLGSEILWNKLRDNSILTIWAVLTACSIYWGLTHEKDMQRIFTKAKTDYEKDAVEAISAGLDIPPQYPFNSLGHFYSYSEDLVSHFQSITSPLPGIPFALANAPEIARRL